MEKGYPEVARLFVFVCVQKGGRAAPEPARPAPPGRPRRLAAGGRGAPRPQAHARRRRGPTGPREGRPTPDPRALPPARGGSPSPLGPSHLPATFPPCPLPAPSWLSGRRGPCTWECPRERAPPGNLLNLANPSGRFRPAGRRRDSPAGPSSGLPGAAAPATSAARHAHLK